MTWRAVASLVWFGIQLGEIQVYEGGGLLVSPYM